MTAPTGAAAIAAAMLLCGLWTVPAPRAAAAASTNTLQRGISVARATVTARGVLPAGSGAPDAGATAVVAGGGWGAAGVATGAVPCAGAEFGAAAGAAIDDAGAVIAGLG